MVDSTNFFTALNGGGSSQILGLSSGINTQEIVKALVAARRQPAVQLENKISANDARLAAYGELRTLITDFKSALDGLRGEVGFFADSVFDNKVAFTQSRPSATAPGGHVASSADSILGVSVSDKAQPGVHTVEVQQLARAHQLRTDAVADKGATLASQGITTGTFDINGQTINVDGDDSLIDLRDKINSSGAGVKATVVSASPTQHFLVINAEDTGVVNTISFGGGTATSDSLGITDGVGGIKNELQAAADAIIEVDNLGVSVVRSSNTFDDVIEGVTIDLFRAEPDTEIEIEVENDLGAVKEKIIALVDAFNAFKDFVDDQRAQVVREEGGEAEYGPLAFDTTLRSLNTQIGQLIGQTVPGQPTGAQTFGQVGIDLNANYRLEIDDDTLDNQLLTNFDNLKGLFEFNFSSNDSRVSLAGFNGQVSGQVDGSGNPIPYYLNVGGTDATGNVTSANIQTAAGLGLGGGADGSTSVNGKQISALDPTGANGLRLFYDGGISQPGADGIEFTVTRGIADQLYYVLDRFVGETGGGSIAENEQSIIKQNDGYNRRISDIEARVELFRARTVARFAAMEQAVLTANNLKESLSSAFESANSQK